MITAKPSTEKKIILSSEEYEEFTGISRDEYVPPLNQYFPWQYPKGVKWACTDTTDTVYVC